ncbi:MAG TPA: hypothetical protein VF322_07985 [Gammaproteobacteria bacterium]
MSSVPQAPTFAAKAAFLARRESLPDRPDAVERIDTHFARVFLSDRLVYKLKKPIRVERADFTAPAARRAYCELEVTLNRRLAADTYLRTVPLVETPAGLALDGEGEPVDWLVEMRRLPAARTLEAVAAQGAVRDADLVAVVRKLVRFYRETPRAPWDAPTYAALLERRAGDYARQLAAAGPALDAARVARVAAAQRALVAASRDALASRIAAGRVVDAHGDLRPEHVFLTDDPQLIDCLEFSIELRWLDTAEEIAFLDLELERLGHAALGARLTALYRELSGDDAPRELVLLYRSQRAVVRALLSAWHLPGRSDADADRWTARARWYLGAAEAALAQARGRCP